jgi:protein-disulfide isomerase
VILFLIKAEGYQLKLIVVTINIFLYFLFLCPGSACAEGDISALPGEILPAVSRLNKAQQDDFLNLIKDINNYGTCEDTVFSCLNRQPPDRVAVRNTTIVVFLISNGARNDDVKRILAERAKFAKETTKFIFTLDGGPAKGDPNARIVVVDFAEFKCPYCWDLVPTLNKLVEESKGRVKVVFKHFPLKSHKGSLFSSTAAEAAHRQGRFWEMGALLYSDMKRQEREDIESHARKLGLDMQLFKRDMEEVRLLEDIERDKSEGVLAGVSGTPSLFVNGKAYKMPRHESFLKDVINDEAVELGLEPPFPDPYHSN